MPITLYHLHSAQSIIYCLIIYLLVFDCSEVGLYNRNHLIIPLKQGWITSTYAYMRQTLLQYIGMVMKYDSTLSKQKNFNACQMCD